MPAMPEQKVAISTVKVDDAVVFGDSDDKMVYCMKVVDPVNQIFQGVNGKDKSTVKVFTSTDMVLLIPVPGLGAVILAGG